MSFAKRLYDSIGKTSDIPATPDNLVWQYRGRFSMTYRFRDGSRFRVIGKTVTWGFGKFVELKTIETN